MDPIFQKIPISKIMPNPDQPRESPTEEEIQEMAANMLTFGQQTIIKVRPLTLEEKAQFSPVEYLIIGGELRWREAKLAGLVALNCEEMDISPTDTHLASVLDNNQRDMNWWEWDLAIEKESKYHKGISQRDLAKRVMKTQPKVNGALKILKVLSPVARRWVTQNLRKAPKTLNLSDQNPIIKNKGFLINEYMLLALADLEQVPLVENGLKLVLDEYLTQAQIKRLVKWVKDGNPLESFDPKAPKVASTPSPRRGEGGDEGAVKTNPTDPPQGEKLQDLKASSQQAAQTIKQAASKINPKNSKSRLAFIGHFSLILGPVLWKGLKWLVSSEAPKLLKSAFYVLLAGGLFRLGFPLVIRGLAHTPKPVVRANQTQKGPEPTPVFPPAATATSVGASISSSSFPTLTPVIPARLEEEAKFVKTLAEQVYGVSYQNMMDWMDYLKTALAHDYVEQFYKAFYPDGKINEINNKKFTLYFQLTKPVEFLNVYGDSDDFEVQGVVTTKSDLNSPGEVVSTQPVTLTVGVLHGTDLKRPFSVGRMEVRTP